MADRHHHRDRDRVDERRRRERRSDEESPQRRRQRSRSPNMREIRSGEGSRREEDRRRRRDDRDHSNKREDYGRGDSHGRNTEGRYNRSTDRDHRDDRKGEDPRRRTGGEYRGDGPSGSKESRKHGDKGQNVKDGSPHRPWFDMKDKSAKSEPTVKKAEPDFGVSGKLAAETNTLNGVLIKYSEPPEARIPKTRWRFYQFKGDELQNTLYLHRQSAYLIGRDRKIVDFPIDHPSCSKQHAVLQYRLTDYAKEDGRKGKKVKPYIIDLESTNGTYVNNNRIENRRFFELKEKDMVKFGFSSREYVLLHENSKDSEDEGEANEDMIAKSSPS